MANADSIAEAVEQLRSHVQAVADFIQIVSTSSVWNDEAGASVASFLCYIRDPLLESMEAVERSLKEKISASEVSHG